MQEQNLRKGPWFEEEDEQLTVIVGLLGERRWDVLARASGLRRSGKSCRLRWMNYLRPNLKHGKISIEEEWIIAQLHQQWGNKWSKIARRLPGRTDNEIKNYWRSHLKRKFQAQEQEKFGNLLVHNGEENNLTSHCKDISQNVSNGGCKAEKSELSIISIEASKTFEPTVYSFPSSPYETRIWDWISCCSYEGSDSIQQHCRVDSSYCLARMSAGNETGLWGDSSISIWNMDY